MPSGIGLQWGHAEQAWKTVRSGITIRRRLALQWGHAEHSVEDASRPVEPEIVATLQWGHAEHSVEDELCEHVHMTDSIASMGPR